MAGAPDQTAPEQAALPPEEEVKPVYAAGPALPVAGKLCAALHDLPETRRAQCCSGKPRQGIAGECVRALSAALRSGAVTVDEGAVQKCLDARGRSFEGCSWVGERQPPLPAECEDLLRGKLAAGAVCRSSLECQDGQHCLGVGPTDPGRCGPPRPDGQACLTAVDSLAVYTWQDLDQRHHPECAGFCGHRKCEPIVPAGQNCSLARQCAPGLHCDGEKCVAGPWASAGDKCVGDSCAKGLRCMAGRCSAPKPDGARCTSDAECLGGCIPATRVCGMRCDVR